MRAQACGAHARGTSERRAKTPCPCTRVATCQDKVQGQDTVDAFASAETLLDVEAVRLVDRNEKMCGHGKKIFCFQAVRLVDSSRASQPLIPFKVPLHGRLVGCVRWWVSGWVGGWLGGWGPW